MGKKRERGELIHDILRVVHDHGGSIKPTHLLYKANLSYDALTRYAEELISSDLLAILEEDGRKLFVLTERGHLFLDQCRRFRKITDAFGV